MIGEESAISISLAIIIGGAVFALWWRLTTLVNTEASERRGVEKELADFKLYAAQTYATRDGVTDAIRQAIEEIKGLRTDTKEGLSDLGERIGRMESFVMERGRVEPPR